jgi:hypothetical protein
VLSGSDIIEEVLTLLKEPYDLANHTADLSHWTRATILRRCNMAQDEISLYIPDLLRITDTSLLTVAGQIDYSFPTGIGIIYQISINGSQLLKTTMDTLQNDSLRGEIDEYWQTIADVPYYFYTINENTLGLWPAPAASGQVISIDAEMILTEMSDASSSYPMENIAALRKGQKALIYIAAANCALEDGNTKLWQGLKAESNEILSDLKTYWMVMRPTSPESMIKVLEIEDTSENIIRPPRYIR